MKRFISIQIFLKIYSFEIQSYRVGAGRGKKKDGIQHHGLGEHTEWGCSLSQAPEETCRNRVTLYRYFPSGTEKHGSCSVGKCLNLRSTVRLHQQIPASGGPGTSYRTGVLGQENKQIAHYFQDIHESSPANHSSMYKQCFAAKKHQELQRTYNLT